MHQDGGYTCVQVFFFRTGQNWGNRAYFPKADRALEPGEVLSAFIAQFYDDKPPPRLVLVSHAFEDVALLADALTTKAGRKVEARTAEIDVRLTMGPPPCSRITGAAALVQRNGPGRLTASTRFQSSSVVSSNGLNTAMPALLTSASSRPKRSLMCAIAACTAALSETSQCSASVLTGSARPP